MSRFFATVAALTGIWTGAHCAEIPRIEVIYPDTGQRIGAVDSTFIFGNVTPGSRLSINRLPVAVHDNGAFLAFLPLRSGEFVFELQAILDNDTASAEVPVVVPERYLPPPSDSMKIVPGFRLPDQPLGLMVGDKLELSFRGTPDCFAYAGFSNDRRLVPMTEEAPKTQRYWGQSLFGAGHIPDSVLVRGSYSGVVTLREEHVSDSVAITFLLCRKKLSRLESDSVGLVPDTATCDCVVVENDARLVVFAAGEVMIGELIDSVQIIRTGPRKGYLSIFQPRGVKFHITGFYGDYLRAALAPSQTAWLPDSSVRFLPQGTRLPLGEVSLLRTQNLEDGVLLTFDTGMRLPFRVEEDMVDSELQLDVYGCTSNIDWIRYDYSDELIRLIRWSQPQERVLRLTIDLAEPIWGYDCYYEGTLLNLKLKSIPELRSDLEGLRIAIDPGHSPDPGAVGPTGFMEKDANHAIAARLRDILIHKRAGVILTRGPDDSVGLYQRPEIAYGYRADIYISIHNNALPDGVNPFVNSGISTYYYHPHSRRLAEFVHEQLLEKIDSPDFGLYYANFAVARPTGYLAVLVECAFMLLPEQEEALQKESYQKDIADGIAEGILKFVESEKDRWR